MKQLSKNKLVTALLALWVALAPAFALFPAAAMAMEMSLSGTTSPDCCDGCASSEVDCDICTVMCRIAAQAATETAVGHSGLAAVGATARAFRTAPPGRAPPPDHAPPKVVPHI